LPEEYPERAKAKESNMVGQTLTLADLKEMSIEKILRDVVEQHVTVTVLLPDGKEVAIGPKLGLQPLPELEGRVPEDWKDAVYVRN
jgi:hypothetical protein